VGWLLKSGRMRKHVNSCGGVKLWVLWDVSVRFITPLMLIVVVGSAIIQEFQGCYEGYPVKSLVIFGGGILFVSRLGSFVLSHFSWPKEKLVQEHEPEDEVLLT